MSFNLGSAHGEIVIDYNGAGVQQAMGDLSSLSQQGTNLLRAGAGVTAFGAAIGGALLGATNQAADFQFQMDAVNAALGGLDASGMEAVTQQALDMGAATKFSAGEVAGVQEQLAKSGLSTEQLMGGATQAVLDLASATGESLQPAAVSTAAALNLFGISADDTAKVADILTAGLNASSATLPDFQRGINSLGPVMANLNQYANDGAGAFRDTAAAVAYFNANGLKAADAGISLARGLTNLATPTSKAANLMTELGIAAFDAQGNFIGFPELFDQLQTQMSGMSDAERENALATIFGAEAADVMNQAVKKGGDGLRDYQAQLESNGQAAKQAAIRQNNLRGALENLSGSVQTAAIALGTPFLGPLQAAAQALTQLVNVFTNLPPEVQGAIAGFLALAAALTLVGGGAITVAGAILRFGPAFAAAAAAAAPFLAIMLAIGAAIGLGILAYKTDFLGFGTAVNKAFGTAQKAIKNFSAGFNAALFRGQEAGLNTLANAVQAFGDALLFATGIDITGFTDRASAAIQQFGNTWAYLTDRGVTPAVAGLFAFADALDTLGLPSLSQQVDNLAQSAANFGAEFAASSAQAREAGFSGLAANIIAFGDALDYVTGLPVEPFFRAVAGAVQVFGTSFETAHQTLDPFRAGLVALRDTLTQLTGIDLAPVFDQLGESIQSATDGVQTFIQTLQAGDIAGAMDQIGSAFSAALSGLGDQLGQLASTIGSTLAGLVVDLTDWVLNVAAPTLAGWINAAAGWLQLTIGGIVNGVGGALAELSNWILTVAAPTLAGWVNAAGGWLSLTLGNLVSGIGGVVADLADWTVNVAAPTVSVATADISAAIGDALNAALASIDVAALLDIASFASKVGAAFHNVASAISTAAVVALRAALSDPAALANITTAVTTAMAALGAAAIAAVVGFAAGFVVGGEVDFSAFANSIRDKFTTALNSIFGNTAQAGLGGTGVTNNIVQQLSDQIFTMFNDAAAEIAARVATIDWSAIPQAVAHGIGDALANFGTQLFGASTAEAAGGGDTFDAAAFGTQFGDQLATSFESPEFIDAVTASVEAMPAATFQTIGTGILTKISEAISTAMQAAGPGAVSETGQGTSPLGADMGTAIITSIATGLQTAIDSAPIETFAAIGTSLVTKIQGAISAAMTTASTGGQAGPVGEGAVGGLGAQLVQSLATSIASSITEAPIEAFAAIGTALQTKISEVLSTAMQAGGGQATPQAGLGGTGGGGGIGQAIAQSIASAIAAADFATVASALQTQLTTVITTAITQTGTVIATGLAQWVAEFSTGFTNISTVVTNGMTTISTAATTGMTAVTTAITSGMAAAQAAVSAAITAITAQFTAFATAATTAGQQAGTGFADGITAGLSAAQAAAQSAVDAIIGILNSAADGAYAAGQAVGEGFASGMEASLGRVQAAAAAMADAAAEGLAAAAQIASPSKVAMALGEQFGQGFELGIAGAAPNAAKSAYDMGFESIHALAESLRNNAETTRSRVRNLGDNIRENQGMATGGGQPMTIETTGSVDLDGEQMGTFTVETVLGGLVGAQRKGGKRRGRIG